MVEVKCFYSSFFDAGQKVPPLSKVKNLLPSIRLIDTKCLTFLHCSLALKRRLQSKICLYYFCTCTMFKDGYEVNALQIRVFIFTFQSCMQYAICKWNDFFKSTVTYPCLSWSAQCVPCRFFDHCILTSRALKFILYDIYSNVMLNMWPVKLIFSFK